jgi:hypothetical protein
MGSNVFNVKKERLFGESFSVNPVRVGNLCYLWNFLKIINGLSTISVKYVELLLVIQNQRMSGYGNKIDVVGWKETKSQNIPLSWLSVVSKENIRIL